MSSLRDLARQGLRFGTVGLWATAVYTVAAAVALARHLVATYQIPRGNLVRHLDISPGRKTDPAGIDWASFVRAVYGEAG